MMKLLTSTIDGPENHIPPQMKMAAIRIVANRPLGPICLNHLLARPAGEVRETEYTSAAVNIPKPSPIHEMV